MLEWSPATMSLIISMHLSTLLYVPRIWMGMVPPQEPWPFLSIMWHFLTPLICRTVSMVWPRRPRRWPFLLVGTSMIRSSSPFDSRGAERSVDREAPAAAARAASTEAVLFAEAPLLAGAAWAWLPALRLPAVVACASAARAEDSAAKLVALESFAGCGAAAGRESSPGPSTVSRRLPGAAMNRSIRATAFSTACGGPAMKSLGWLSVTPCSGYCWISM
mmetsp:Transcript_104133/g.310986  ORF Transcript_104133/g.310986 Transcript_104133/m.310986 type:complete len:219 (+) Transcript_104133:495-1151(+)